jgi:Ca2+ transporting ATPase
MEGKIQDEVLNEFAAKKMINDEIHEDNKNILYYSIAQNSTGNLIINNDSKKEERVGNQTECGLLEFIRFGGADYHALRADAKELYGAPFNSRRKRMTTIVEHPTDSSIVRVYSKGASEIVLARCKTFLAEDGSTADLEQEMIEEIEENVIDHFAKQAYRTLTLGYKEIARDEYDSLDLTNEDAMDEFENDMTLVCIVGIQDPLRPEIVSAMGDCKKAGVTVRMVTGDNPETAKAISKNAGIIPDSDIVSKYAIMTGKDFREYVGGLVKETDKDGKVTERVGDVHRFKQVAKELRVLARSSPDDKYLLVTGLKNEGSVVAVTGDGTNDAPALKKADVGFAMGITGTELAKEAADIILLDDNFKSIITAILWGRNIYNSIRKFLQFQLTVNVVAMFIAFVGGVVLGDSPLTPVQLLWVNLIMDTFAALALATEPPEEDLLNEKPHPKDESIVTPCMWRNIIGQAIFQIAILCVILFAGKTFLPGIAELTDPKEIKLLHYTYVFNTFVFMQVFNEINARKLKPDGKYPK